MQNSMKELTIAASALALAIETGDLRTEGGTIRVRDLVEWAKFAALAGQCEEVAR